MASWKDVQAHMRNTYKLQQDEPHRLAMAWSYEDGRTQKVVVRRFEQGDVEMVEIKSPFARLGGPDPVELLRENARLPYGAVALVGDVFVVVHNLELGALDDDAFDAWLTRIAGLADQLEQKHAEPAQQAADAF